MIKLSTQTTLAGLLALLTLSGLWLEVWGYRAKAIAFRAQGLAAAQRNEEALSEAERAIRNDPWIAQGLHLRAVKFKDAGRWTEMESAVAPLLLVSPNQGVAERLAAEAALRIGNQSADNAHLSNALWINPHPPTGPTNYWRAFMMTAEQSGEQHLVLGAAMRTAEFTSDDPILQAESRIAVMNDVSGVLQRAGLNRTAAHLQNAGRAAAKSN